MATWRILSNYRAFGLRETVKIEAASLRKRLHIRADVARRMALIQVRTALVQSINKGQFHG
jgi:hypothetical protein